MMCDKMITITEGEFYNLKRDSERYKVLKEGCSFKYVASLGAKIPAIKLIMFPLVYMGEACTADEAVDKFILYQEATK